jgi:hypothetical protein
MGLQRMDKAGVLAPYYAWVAAAVSYEPAVRRSGEDSTGPRRRGDPVLGVGEGGNSPRFVLYVCVAWWRETNGGGRD